MRAADLWVYRSNHEAAIAHFLAQSRHGQLGSDLSAEAVLGLQVFGEWPIDEPFGLAWLIGVGAVGLCPDG